MKARDVRISATLPQNPKIATSYAGHIIKLSIILEAIDNPLAGYRELSYQWQVQYLYTRMPIMALASHSGTWRASAHGPKLA